MNATKEIVALSFDVDALKQSMRFAFANDLTVVQELIQNARRAGATTVWINTGESLSGEKTLSVMDNGAGIEKFEVLLRVAKSGWGDEVQANEGPYGMGFIACIYAARCVDVVSRGKVLTMEQDKVLANGEFEVEDFEGQLPEGVVTSVTLHGIDTEKVKNQMQTMVRGYPIEIVFNGTPMARADSIDGSFRKTAVGYIKRQSGSFSQLNFRVYLQGFQVFDSTTHFHCLQDVVHLDSTRFFGKFPDRNVVINQEDMLKEVRSELKALYVDALMSAAKRLSPLVFMETYRKLAEDLGMLHLFNDFDVIPKSFLQELTAMPHDTEWREAYLQQGADGGGFTRAEIEQGAVLIGDLDTFMTEDDADNCKRWIFAYAAKAWMLKERLDNEHWIHNLVSIHADSIVTMEAVGICKKAAADSRRTNCIGVMELVICDDVKVSMDDRSFMLGEAVADESSGQILVPSEDGKPRYVGGFVMKQVNSYRWDDQYNEAECDADEEAVNQMVRELASDTPEGQLALALEAAIASYSGIRSLSCTFTVTDRGVVTVQALGEPA